ncbi:zf-HC2 domain-containing protein [Streptomyces varsoviensis]|uniref:zf-HC2 domain-containing protein n=1 Tax=Streptomyces varsoviensis TaxID=67373 RepID=UPI0033C77A3F
MIDDYARGDTGMATDEVWALETHLETCPVCRERLAVAATTRAPAVTALVDAVWSDLEPRLAATATAPRRRRRPAWLSGWLAPAAVPWLATAVSVTVLALLLDLADIRLGGVSLVLLLAPVLPVLGVAASWSRGLDPAYELTTAAPRAGLHLVLRRTAAVLAVVVPALLVCGWVTGVMVAQGLLPCLAFTSATLALGGVIGMTRAALALVGAWAAAVVAPAVAVSHAPLALRPDGLPVWGLVLVLGAAVVAARRGAYTVLGARR